MTGEATFVRLTAARVAVAVWVAFAAVMVWHKAPLPIGELLRGPDDHTRIVRVQQFVDGAGWYADRLQRVDPPHGAPLHWSRLPDLPLAAAYAAGSAWGGEAAGVRLAAIGVPLGLGLAAILVTVWAARPLIGGAEVGAAALVAVTAPNILAFAPGRVDHHAWTILATVAGVGAVIRIGVRARAAWRGAAAGGAAIAGGLAIAGASLQSLFALNVGLGVLWLAHGRCVESGTRVFAASLGGTALALWPVSRAPPAWDAVACDAFSLPYVTVALLVAVFWWLAPLAARRGGLSRRLAVGGGLALLGGAGLWWAFPACREGALAAVPPDQWRTWLNHTNGLKPLWEHGWATIAQFAVPATVALAGAGGLAWRDRDRRGIWLAAAAMLAVMMGLGAVSARASNLTLAFAVPVVTVLLVAVWHACDRRLREPMRGVAILAVSLAILAAPVWTHLAATRLRDTGTNGAGASCDRARLHDAVAPLRIHEPGIVAAEIFNGPFILTGTARHAVLSVPYHRNVQGNRKGMAVFRADTAADALRAVRRHGVAHLVVCEAGEPLGGAFVNALPATRPAWLRRLDGPAGIGFAVYAVRAVDPPAVP